MNKKYIFIFLLKIVFIAGCTQSSPFYNRNLNLYGYNIEQQSISEQGNNIWQSDSFPIHITIDCDIEQYKKEQIILAIEQWNNVVGFNVFIWQEEELENYIFYGQIREPEQNNIFVLQAELGYDVNNRNILGLTTNYYTNNQIYIKSSIVQFDEELANDDFYHVALHEFGHALGLRHDQGDISSIMFPHALSSFGMIKIEDILYIRNQH